MIGVGHRTGGPFDAGTQARSALAARIERRVHIDQVKTPAARREISEARQAVTLGDSVHVLFSGLWQRRLGH
jgi:hypothetical protein